MRERTATGQLGVTREAGKDSACCKVHDKRGGGEVGRARVAMFKREEGLDVCRSPPMRSSARGCLATQLRRGGWQSAKCHTVADAQKKIALTRAALSAGGCELTHARTSAAVRSLSFRAQLLLSTTSISSAVAAIALFAAPKRFFCCPRRQRRMRIFCWPRRPCRLLVTRHTRPPPPLPPSPLPSHPTTVPTA